MTILDMRNKRFFITAGIGAVLLICFLILLNSFISNDIISQQPSEHHSPKPRTGNIVQTVYHMEDESLSPAVQDQGEGAATWSVRKEVLPEEDNGKIIYEAPLHNVILVQ